VVAGSRSFAAIGQWAADAGPEVLAVLGAARGPAEESTFRRAFALISPDVLDRVLGAWLWTRAVRAAAKAFLLDYYQVLPDSIKASTGYNQPVLKDFRKKPMAILGEDPKLNPLQDFDQVARAVGYPGPPTAAAGRRRRRSVSSKKRPAFVPGRRNRMSIWRWPRRTATCLPMRRRTSVAPFPSTMTPATAF